MMVFRVNVTNELRKADVKMKFEYLFVSYIQEKGGYRFYEKFRDTGIKVTDYREFLPVLNHYGKDGWEFICWDNGRLLFKRELLNESGNYQNTWSGNVCNE